MIEVFRTVSIGSQFHADIVFNVVTPRFPKGAASDSGAGSTKREDVVDSLANGKAFEL